MIVTDGSVKYGMGSFGGVIMVDEKQLKRKGRVSGSPELMNSFRAEAGGPA